MTCLRHIPSQVIIWVSLPLFTWNLHLHSVAFQMLTFICEITGSKCQKCYLGGPRHFYMIFALFKNSTCLLCQLCFLIGWNFKIFSQQPCVWWKCYMVGMCLIWPFKKFLFSLFLVIGNQSPTGYHGTNIINIIFWNHSHLKANLVVMFIGWPFTKIFVFCVNCEKNQMGK